MAITSKLNFEIYLFFQTWRDSFGKIIDRLEKLRQEILSVEATECGD